MRKKIRLVDIAAQANVSIATVSRVLNDSGPVSPETEARVLTAIDLLGYERPESLTRTTRGLIGLLVPELTNPVFPALAQEIEAAMIGEGFVPVLCTQYAGGTTEDEYVAILRRQKVSGIIFVSGLHADMEADPGRYERLRGDTPFVTINGANPHINAPDVSTNDADAMFQAVEYLSGLGHTKIGLVMGPARFIPSRRKEQGYRKAMAKFAPQATPRVINTFFTFEGGISAANSLLERGYTAMLCGSDLMALGAAHAARTAGLSVPEDLSVVGFDDSRLMALTNPPLTTLRQPVRSIARYAVNTLVAEISGKEVDPNPMQFNAELIVRGSTAPCTSI